MIDLFETCQVVMGPWSSWEGPEILAPVYFRPILFEIKYRVGRELHKIVLWKFIVSHWTCNGIRQRLKGPMWACETSAPDTSPALWELHSPNFTLTLSVYCLYFSCLTPSPYPVSFWAANFNLKLDWADRMQIPRGKTQKLMNSYVKSILHHREKVTSARQKPTRLKRQGFSRVISLLYILFTVSHPSENWNCQNYS